jgi:hypothetical protein
MSTPTLLERAERLAAVLTAENAALSELDLPRVAALGTEKREAAEALAAAPSGPLLPASRAQLESCGSQLTTLVVENRRLLERAIAVQARVIAIIARAGKRELAHRPATYGRRGAPVASSRPPAMAIMARV